MCHSALKVKDAVNQVILLGMSALAITNYDSIYATHELAKYANSVTEDLKTIVGCEMHVAPIYKADKKKLILQTLLI
ncbi:MAG: PHP domain-containing protein [Duncaniella sp.]|nr:PHP domain-containing protein [Duncaniella sp.]